MRALNKLTQFARKWNISGIRQSLERKKLRRIANANSANATIITASPGHSHEPLDVDALLTAEFINSRPLETHLIPTPKTNRLSVITDSINAGSLFGGVGTALILGALICKRTGWQLRIITRTEPADSSNLQKLLKLFNINLDSEVVFTHASIHDRKCSVDIFQGEQFLTTSWWTTYSALTHVPSASIIYLLQEDERMFYPAGDTQLRCANTMANEDIRIIINSELLHQHLAKDFPAIKQRAQFFEPAFPKDLYHPSKNGKSSHKLFFYARPKNPRNLFYLGLEVLNAAATQGIIPDDWEIIMVGASIAPLTLANGHKTIALKNLGWDEYAELIGTIDVALSLMYTPHPSYPPLDLAASGAVVVTNSCLNKQDLSVYSENIITCPPTVADLVQGLKAAIKLAQDTKQREDNLNRNQLNASWSDTLDHIISIFPGTRHASSQ
jgi:O-antigen biosynthesis protein